MKAILRRITENRLAKRLVACFFIPLCVIQAEHECRNLVRITFSLTLEQGIAQMLPYIICCTLVVAITTLAKKFMRKLRGQYRLLGS